MLTIKSINPDSQLSTALAVYFAKLALPVWQKKHPEDLRLEKAIKAAEKALFVAASDAAYVAAYVAASDAASADAARAAYAADASDAARAAAHAARAAARVVTYAARAASNAARAASNAAYALDKNDEYFVHHHLTQLLPVILWHKLNTKRSFGEP